MYHRKPKNVCKRLSNSKKILTFAGCMNKKLISAISAGLIVLCGCSGDQTEAPKPLPQPVNEFSLSKTSISADYEAGSAYVDVATDLPWAASSAADWVKLKPSSGVGKASVWISWLENAGFTNRDAAITFEAEVSGNNMTYELTINQGHKVEASHIVSTRAVLGNLAKAEEDSVELVFDRPTDLLYYESASELYQLTTKAEKIGDGTCWRLPLKIAGAGGEYGIRMAWKSAVDGIESRDTIYVPFCDKSYKLPQANGSIRYSALALDKKSLWVAVAGTDYFSTDSNVLMQLSLDDMKLLKTVKMPFAPRHICVNPYNGLLYVSGRKDYISVVDPASGKVVKKIQIETSPNAHPQYPTIYADEVAFTSDGFGIVRLVANGASILEWRYIDSANDDKITLSGYSWAEHQLEHLYVNYDRSRIYANMYPSTYTTIEWFNRQNPVPNKVKIDGKFQSDKFYAGGSLTELSMSPFANKAFICTAPSSECVVSLDAPVGYSEVLEIEARGSTCVWDGLVTDRDYVYHICNTSGLLVLYDMTRGEAIYGTRHEFSYANEAVKCHFLPTTNQLLVTANGGIYILDAAKLKAKSL